MQKSLHVMKTNFDLTKMREKLGLTQESLAEQMGLSREYISMLENGRREVSEKFVNKFINVYGDVNIEDTKKAPQNETRMDNLENEIKEIKENLETIKNLLLKILAK